MDNDLRIYAKGNAFKDGVYDLRSLELLVVGYRSILDNLLAVQLGYRKLRYHSKQQFHYNVRLNSGSIELLIDFVINHPEVAIVLFEDGGHQVASRLTALYRDAIKLRQLASEFIEKGLNINISISDSFNWKKEVSNVVVRDNGIMISDSKTLFAAQATKYSTDRLLRRIDGDSLENINMSSEEDSISFDQSNKNILGRDKRILNAKINIIGRLDMIAFSSHRGVIVSESERFPVIWDDEIRAKMQRIADVDGAVFTVLPIIDRARLDNDAIGFHVLDCEDPHGNIEY